MSNTDIGKIAKLANTARNKKLTAAQRSKIASIASKVRWKKYKKRQSHICKPMCICANCHRPKFKHVKGGELCSKFLCEDLA